MNDQFPYYSSDQSGSSDRPAQSHEDSPAVSGEQSTLHLPNSQAVTGLLLGIVSILLGLMSLGGYLEGDNLPDSTMISNQLRDFIGTLTLLLPLAGIGVAIGGLVVSNLGQRMPSRKGMAMAGIVLSLIGLWQAISIYYLLFLAILLVINQI